MFIYLFANDSIYFGREQQIFFPKLYYSAGCWLDSRRKFMTLLISAEPDDIYNCNSVKLFNKNEPFQCKLMYNMFTAQGI